MPAKFPRVKEFLSSEWEALQFRKTVSVAEVAKKAGFSSSALYAWLDGQRVPKSESAKELSEIFYPVEADQQRFVAQLNEAAKSVASTGGADPLEAFMNGHRSVRVGSVEYGEVSGFDEARFFSRLFSRFSAFAGLRLNVETERLSLSDVPQLLLDKGRFDVVLGILATADRALRMRFIQLPLSIPLNAVVPLGAISGVVTTKILESSLSQRSQFRNVSIRPIVNDMEIGGRYVANYLDLAKEEYDSVDEYTVDKMAKSLGIASENFRRRPDSPIPVVLVDELCAIQICERLNPEVGKPKYGLVFEPSTVEMPKYRLSIAVNRRHRDWALFLEDALRIYSQSNPHIVARQLLELRAQLLAGHSPKYAQYIEAWFLGAELDRDNPFHGPYSAFHELLEIEERSEDSEE